MTTYLYFYFKVSYDSVGIQCIQQFPYGRLQKRLVILVLPYNMRNIYRLCFLLIPTFNPLIWNYEMLAELM